MSNDLSELLQRIHGTVNFGSVDKMDVNSKGLFWSTPLHVVTTWQDATAMKLLLDHGADVNAKGEYGETPLIRSTFLKAFDCVEVLLRAGADPYIAGDDGLDSFMTAKAVGASVTFEEVLRRATGT